MQCLVNVVILKPTSLINRLALFPAAKSFVVLKLDGTLVHPYNVVEVIV